MTRNGKIARLPQAVRNELNQRLADGEPGDPLVTWLNGLPETRKALARHFQGRPIREQNLSEWRQGGFLDWQRHQAVAEDVRRWTEETADFNAAKDGAPLSDRVATVLTARLMAETEAALRETPEPAARLALLRAPLAELRHLRRDDHAAARERRERRRFAREEATTRRTEAARRQAKTAAEEREERQRWIAPLTAGLHANALARALGGTPHDFDVARILLEAHRGLAPGTLTPPAAASSPALEPPPAAADSSRSNPAESDSIRPAEATVTNAAPHESGLEPRSEPPVPQPGEAPAPEGGAAASDAPASAGAAPAGSPAVTVPATPSVSQSPAAKPTPAGDVTAGDFVSARWVEFRR